MEEVEPSASVIEITVPDDEAPAAAAGAGANVDLEAGSIFSSEKDYAGDRTPEPIPVVRSSATASSKTGAIEMTPAASWSPKPAAASPKPTAPKLTREWTGAKKNRLQFRALILRTLAHEVCRGTHTCAHTHTTYTRTRSSFLMLPLWLN